MSEQLVAEIAGLQLSNNTFTSSPPGSCSTADNILIQAKGVAQARNGVNRVGARLSDSALPKAMTEFLGSIVVSSSANEDGHDGKLGYYSSGSVSNYSSFGGTFNPVDWDENVIQAYKMKFGFAGQYLHFCTDTGPKTLEAVTGQPRTSGLSPLINPIAYETKLTNNNWMPYNSAVAYRTVTRRMTSDGVSLLSPPSARTITTNRIYLPAGSLTKAAGVATGTLPANEISGLTVGDSFTLTPGEGSFPAGLYTVATTPTAYSFTFAIGAGTATSTVDQDCDVGLRAPFVVAYLNQYSVAGDFLRVYRSNATSSSSITPSDELYLSNEILITSTHITNGYVTLTDSTPESVLNVPLYTNSFTGEGALAANYQPPIYRDITNYDSRTWYSNTTNQQSLGLEILGIGGPNGIQNNDTITFADSSHSVTLTFKTTASGPGEIQIVSSSTLPSQNIKATAQNLMIGFWAMTPFGGGTKWGWQMTSNAGFNDGEGKLLVTRIDFINDPISIKVSRPLSWTPALSASTDTYTDNGRAPNQLIYAKEGQPEAVPITNYLSIGVKNFAIRRILGLRNALLVFKEGDGIWSITGSAGAYNVRQISTANIIAPDCCAIFSDIAWVYTDQGILRVTDSGGAVVESRPIETELNRLDALFPDQTNNMSFAVPYETDRRIMFYIPVAEDLDRVGGVRLEAYSYSIATNSWTRFNAQAQCGVVSLQPALWLGIQDNVHTDDGVVGAGRLLQERKSQSYLDMADQQWPSTITAYDSETKTVTLSVASGIGVGTGISQECTVGSVTITFRTKIAELTNDPSSFILAEDMPFTAATCTIYDPFQVTIKLLPIGNATSRKTLTRLAYFYKPEQFSNYFGKVILSTDQLQDNLEIDTPGLCYGSTSYGVGSYGNPTPLVVDTNPISPNWTNAAQFSPGFTLNEVWAKFRLQGLVMALESSVAPVGRGR